MVSTNHIKRRAGIVLGLAGLMVVQSLQAPPTLSSPRPRDYNSTLKFSSAITPVKEGRPIQPGLSQAYGNLPLSFEANRGQTDQQVRFFTRSSDYSIFLTAAQAVFVLNRGPEVSRKSSPTVSRATAMRMKLVGANPASDAVGIDERPGKSHYMIGADPKKWQTNIPTYSRVKYQDIYPGVDMVYYGNQQRLEYDFIVAPGANPRAITLAYTGVRKIALDARGDLMLHAAFGEIRQHKPVVYQQEDGVKRGIECGYVIKRHNRVGFQVGAYDASRPLVIDPVLSYSTYLGGDGKDIARGIAMDTSGNVYLTGETPSADFPTTPGSFRPAKPSPEVRNVFVAKLNAAGTALIYSTYIGGRGNDTGNAIAVDSEGNAYLTGETTSSDFPITLGAFQTTKPGFFAVFVAKLNSTGSSLVYSTYLGGGSDRSNRGLGIAADSLGNSYITGATTSPNFPTANAFQPVFRGGLCSESDFGFSCLDAFITKLNPAGTAPVYSTFLGGDGDDEGRAVCVDSSGSAYVTGWTESADFPVTSGALQTAFAGVGKNNFSGDAFVAKVDASGALVYSTYLGGNDDDVGAGVAVDSAGNAYVTGATTSTNFPTSSGAFQVASGGSAAFKSTDGGLRWSAIGDGLGSNIVLALAIDPNTPSQLYAGTSNGVFKSVNGGSSWSAFNNGLPRGIVITALAIDPDAPSTIYAGCGGISSPHFSRGGVFKSTDGGSSWVDPLESSGLGPVFPINGLAINPRTPSTLYAAVGRFNPPLRFGYVARSTDSGMTWDGARARPDIVYAVAIDPKKPKRVYAGRDSGVIKTTNGGVKWRQTSLQASITALAIDPKDPATLYASGSTFERNAHGNTIEVRRFFNSTDHGSEWKNINTELPETASKAVVFNPQTPSLLYAADTISPLPLNFHSSLGIPFVFDTGVAGGLFRSLDGGQTWRSANLDSRTVNTLAIDPANPNTIYAGVYSGADAFVAKLNPTGSALIYSTYLGGEADDSGHAIAVDAAGNAYVTGQTTSRDFPTKDAFQDRLVRGPLTADAFVAKLNSTGGELIFSTYLGGNGNDLGRGIVVDADGTIGLTGITSSTDFPGARSIQAGYAGGIFDAFVVKIGAP